MITMFHSNPARLEHGVLHVDRKFHIGMQEYVSRLNVPLLTVHPYLPAEQDATVMDLVRVPEKELGYRFESLPESLSGRKITPETRQRVTDLVRQSRLIYGAGAVATSIARENSVPAVAVLEYNFRTTMVFATAGVDDRARRVLRQARAVRYYLREIIPTMRKARLLHCNGYPVYDESRWFNPNRLLYLDSRMRKEMIIGADAQQHRLRERRDRIPRFIFSGRFEAAKGALEVVKVARECASRGLKFALDMYGQGSQRGIIDETVRASGLGATVRVHEPIEYPELVKITQAADVFVCCHIQDDPSCTYLETLGCGIPIAGYGNRMWASMLNDSGAGVVSPIGDAAGLAEAIIRLCRDNENLDGLSLKARAFALNHSFETEFTRRTDSLQEIMRR